MAYNVWRTVRGDEPVDATDQPRVAAAPALRPVSAPVAMKHETLEKNSFILLIAILVVVSIGEDNTAVVDAMALLVAVGVSILGLVVALASADSAMAFHGLLFFVAGAVAAIAVLHTAVCVVMGPLGRTELAPCHRAWCATRHASTEQRRMP